MKDQLDILFEDIDGTQAIITFDIVKGGYQLVTGTGWLVPSWLDKCLGDVFTITQLKNMACFHVGHDLRQCTCGSPHSWQHCHRWGNDPCYCG